MRRRRAAPALAYHARRGCFSVAAPPPCAAAAEAAAAPVAIDWNAAFSPEYKEEHAAALRRFASEIPWPSRPLRVSGAWHSPAMAPAVAPLRAAALSAFDDARVADALAEDLVRPVRFAPALRQLASRARIAPGCPRHARAPRQPNLVSSEAPVSRAHLTAKQGCQ